MPDVTINPDYFGPGNGVFVIANDGGYGTLGFDVTMDRIERYALNLYMDEGKAAELVASVERGTIESYELARELQSELIEVCEARGEKPVADLSPQLVGLEGNRVEVEDVDGERRRFIVGKSTGPLPIHLEIARRDSTGGIGARREYKSVRVLERVR